MNYKDIEKEFDDQYFISTIGRNDFRREKIKAKINSVIDDMIGKIRDEAVLLIRDKREAIKVLKEYKVKFNK